MGLGNAIVRRLKVQISPPPLSHLCWRAWPRIRPLQAVTIRVPNVVFCLLIALAVGATTGALVLRYGVALPLFITARCVLGPSAAYASVGGSTEKK
jgi:hypothetical protein